MKRQFVASAALIALGVAITFSVAQPSSGQPGAAAHPREDRVHFFLKRSADTQAASCLVGANAKVVIGHGGIGPTETMKISAHHLPPNRDFDVFLTQVPNAPFGVSWYEGDLRSDAQGDAAGVYTGRFDVETFMVAPGVAPAPVVYQGDGSQNVASPPIHTYHVGIWFDSPDGAAAAGCPTTVTPFNGQHKAGIQALSTNQFDDLFGPLGQIS